MKKIENTLLEIYFIAIESHCWQGYLPPRLADEVSLRGITKYIPSENKRECRLIYTFIQKAIQQRNLIFNSFSNPNWGKTNFNIIWPFAFYIGRGSGMKYIVVNKLAITPYIHIYNHVIYITNNYILVHRKCVEWNWTFRD